MKEKFISLKQGKRGEYFQVSVNYTDRHGNRTTRSLGQFYVKDYGDKKTALKQAIKARDKALKEIEISAFEYHDLTVDDCFQASLSLFNLSAKTKRWHILVYEQMMDEFLKYMPITKVTTEDVVKNMNAFADTHSKDGISRCRTVWHQIFQTAQMKEIPVIDRTMAIKAPRSKVPTKPRETACTYEDVMVTLENLETYGDTPVAQRRAMHLHDIILVMFYTGMRPQEALALAKSEINFDDELITVYQSVGSTHNKTRQLVTTKTDGSLRQIPIAKEIIPLLHDLCDHAKKDLLFTDRDGKPYEIGDLDIVLINMRKARNLPRVTLYMCRHLFATDVYGMAQNKKAAQRLMGHKSESMTLYYLNDDSKEKYSLVQNRKLS